jgi:hypothetical protein
LVIATQHLYKYKTTRAVTGDSEAPLIKYWTSKEDKTMKKISYSIMYIYILSSSKKFVVQVQGNSHA